MTEGLVSAMLAIEGNGGFLRLFYVEVSHQLAALGSVDRVVGLCARGCISGDDDDDGRGEET